MRLSKQHLAPTGVFGCKIQQPFDRSGWLMCFWKLYIIINLAKNVTSLLLLLYHRQPNQAFSPKRAQKGKK